VKTLLLKNSTVEIGVLEECGHLFPVRFIFENDIIEPMHIAPWTNEELDPSTPPMLKFLRGDFFCAPFGASDLLDEETRPHGTSANEKWKDVEISNSSIKLKLSKDILGAELIKEIRITENESVVYQKHIFKGGKGKIPVGHHAMLKIPSKAYISFSDFTFGGTPPQAIEIDPNMGKSILKYPQQFSDITSILRFDDKIIDASVYPFDHNHEDLFMIIPKSDAEFGWSAVCCPNEGWLWYSIKNRNILPNTVVWFSNGGRYYPPFSSRHKNVIGIEETASFFHLGHKASIENNFLNERGFKTYIELNEIKVTEIPYLFGVVKIPSEFGKVKSIEKIENGIEITDHKRNKVSTKVNLNFVKENK
jgi:hypothetical protein